MNSSHAGPPPSTPLPRNPAPIALFVYNRPEHTRCTLEALRRNPLAAQSNLHIFADGPRSAKDRRKIAEVRQVIADVPGFLSVSVYASDTNRGLAAAIIDGVTTIVNRYGRVIVLEDDLVVSPSFLNYMNVALEHYAEVRQVMHVSGYWFPVDVAGCPDSFFLRVPSSWGWGTWARAWSRFEKNPRELERTMLPAEVRRFNLDDANDFWEQVVHNLNGRANTWAIFWYASIFRAGGLCLYPSRTLVRNIGTDGTGEHCLVTEIYDAELSKESAWRFSDNIEENSLALGALQAFYRCHRMSRVRRLFELTKARASRIFTGGG